MPKVSQAHLDQRRAQILDAAALCFSRRGLHATTMQDIIRQSGLSAGAIYNYFPGKDDIIEAIANERHAREAKEIAGAGRDPDLGDALDRLSRFFFQSMREADERERRRVGVQLWAEALQNDRLHALVRRGVDEPRAMLARMLREAQRLGKLRSDLDPDAIARFLIALFHGFILQQAWDEGVAIEPYLAVIDAAMAGLRLDEATPPAPPADA